MLDNTVTDDLKKIENIYKRWLVGGSATQISADCLPQSWGEMVQQSGGEQLAQRRQTLILSSQQHSWLVRRQPPTDLTVQAPLPELSIPTVSSQLRPDFIRCMALIKKQPSLSPNALLNLMLARGSTAHPADWLPKLGDEVPDVYWPWSQWIAKHKGQGINGQCDSLNEDSWDHFYPAKRLSLLKEMRQIAPEQARELIAKCAMNETAEQRLKIVEVLAIKLSEQDVELLHKLGKDRSKKIALLASQLLSRLNATIDSDEQSDLKSLASELAEWFEIRTTGFIRKKTQLLPKALKSKKQQALRSEWLAKVPVSYFAQALSLDIETFFQYWDYSAYRNFDNETLVKNAAQHLPDNAVHGLVAFFLENLSNQPELASLIRLLLPRLESAIRIEVLLVILQENNVRFRFYDCLPFVDGPIDALDWKKVKKSAAWQELIRSLKEQLTDENKTEEYYNTREIVALGLLTPVDTALEVVSKLLDVGMMGMDPLLEPLKFNIKLADQNADPV